MHIYTRRQLYVGSEDKVFCVLGMVAVVGRLSRD